MAASPTAILLLRCPDQRGLVAKIAGFIHEHNGNIVHADQHTDVQAGLFLLRLEWQLADFNLTRLQIRAALEPLTQAIQASWQIYFSDETARMALWATRQDHCLYDLILRQRAGELPVQIPVIISNHPDLAHVADTFGINYHYVPSDALQEQAQLALLQHYRVDLVVLAKYMRILSPEFLAQAPQVINIHHSFLPAFAGANPYQRAYERGVKIIGATGHYVTSELDAGPIIAQDIVRVSHRDALADLIRKGKDTERIVLARALWLHLNHRVLVYDNRTVVFD